jgi:hypothetical protein
VLEVLVRLHCRCRNLRPKPLRAAAKSMSPRNSDSTKDAQDPIEYYARKPHNNAIFMWLYSLVFAVAEM